LAAPWGRSPSDAETGPIIAAFQFGYRCSWRAMMPDFWQFVDPRGIPALPNR
jgi:hypothetical protein